MNQCYAKNRRKIGFQIHVCNLELLQLLNEAKEATAGHNFHLQAPLSTDDAKDHVSWKIGSFYGSRHH
jgi:hypothetical protein